MKVKYFLLGLLIMLFGGQVIAEMTQEQQKKWFMSPANPISPLHYKFKGIDPVEPYATKKPDVSKGYANSLQQPLVPKTLITPRIIYLGDGRCEKKENGITMSFECEKAMLISYTDGCMRGRFPDGKFLGVNGTILSGSVGSGETCLIEELSAGKCWGYWGHRKDKLLSCSTLEPISQ